LSSSLIGGGDSTPSAQTRQEQSFEKIPPKLETKNISGDNYGKEIPCESGF
jgi:hypothetical protein